MVNQSQSPIKKRRWAMTNIIEESDDNRMKMLDNSIVGYGLANRMPDKKLADFWLTTYLSLTEDDHSFFEDLGFVLVKK